MYEQIDTIHKIVGDGFYIFAQRTAITEFIESDLLPSHVSIEYLQEQKILDGMIVFDLRYKSIQQISNPPEHHVSLFPHMARPATYEPRNLAVSMPEVLLYLIENFEHPLITFFEDVTNITISDFLEKHS